MLDIDADCEAQNSFATNSGVKGTFVGHSRELIGRRAVSIAFLTPAPTSVFLLKVNIRERLSVVIAHDRL
jgi:hypothetical protein